MPMNAQQKITDKIKKALRQSCKDALYFSGDETCLIGAEYLLTVNAAKSIQSLNENFATPYQIYLEHSTQTFATNCTPLVGRDPLKNKVVVRAKNNTDRIGKIDIAIYTERNSSKTPVCAIEVKGFNPSMDNIISDLRRNVEYFSMFSATGKSLISFTVFVALHSYKNTMTDEKEQKNLTKVGKRYEKYIKEVNLPIGIKYKADIFTIRRGTVLDPDDPFIQEMGLQGNEDYHFIGAMICFFT